MLGSLPSPPSDLARRKITIVDFADTLFRTHDIRQGPVFFGKSGLNRFDAPDGSYGVLYAGRDAFCAFIETFGRSAGTRIITTAALKSRSLSELKLRRTARLIDLTRSGALVRMGADGNLFSGEHSNSQAWSKALHGHPLKADGLLYPSRLDRTRHAIVLFSDRGVKLTELSRRGWYDTGAQRHLLGAIMEHYQMELIDNKYVAGRKPAARAIQPPLIDE